MIMGRMYPFPPIRCPRCNNYCIYLTQNYGTDDFEAWIYCTECKCEIERSERVRLAVYAQSKCIEKTIEAVRDLTDKVLLKYER